MIKQPESTYSPMDCHIQNLQLSCEEIDGIASGADAESWNGRERE